MCALALVGLISPSVPLALFMESAENFRSSDSSLEPYHFLTYSSVYGYEPCRQHCRKYRDLYVYVYRWWIAASCFIPARTVVTCGTSLTPSPLSVLSSPSLSCTSDTQLNSPYFMPRFRSCFCREMRPKWTGHICVCLCTEC